MILECLRESCGHHTPYRLKVLDFLCTNDADVREDGVSLFNNSDLLECHEDVSHVSGCCSLPADL